MRNVTISAIKHRKTKTPYGATVLRVGRREWQIYDDILGHPICWVCRSKRGKWYFVS